MVIFYEKADEKLLEKSIRFIQKTRTLQSNITFLRSALIYLRN